MQALQGSFGTLACPHRPRRGLLVCRASASSAPAVYTPPSQRIGANELQALSRLSSVVPDTLLLETPVQLKAATVSAQVSVASRLSPPHQASIGHVRIPPIYVLPINLPQVLKGVLASGQLGLKPFMVSKLALLICRALLATEVASCSPARPPKTQ
jgi:hypothetical protein